MLQFPSSQDNVPKKEQTRETGYNEGVETPYPASVPIGAKAIRQKSFAVTSALYFTL